MVNISVYKLYLAKESSGRYDINKKISSPGDGYLAFKEVFKADMVAEELLMMFTLNTKNVITGAFTASQGSLNNSIVHPREIYKRALVNNAASIIIGHNHPSGDPTPSSEDVNITHRLKEAGKIIGIDLIDHIIIGEDKYTSLKEKGIL